MISYTVSSEPRRAFFFSPTIGTDAADLKRKLEGLGIQGLTEDNFITSAMATATFLHEQKPGGTAYVIGGAGLTNELYNAGYSISESNPDYVVVGKTSSFNYDMMKRAVQLISKGARFVGTNPDVIDPTEGGIEPACGAILASIEQATGKKPLYHRKAECADDDHRTQEAQRTFIGIGDGGRQNGYGYHRGTRRRG